MYWFANSQPPYLAGCRGAPGAITRAVGAENAFADTQAEWPRINWENVGGVIVTVPCADRRRPEGVCRRLDHTTQEFPRSNPWALHGIVEVPDPERDRDDPGDCPAAVAAWHEARVIGCERVLTERGGTAAFLVGDDPSPYDSTLRVVRRIDERGVVPVERDVLPGVSAWVRA